MPTNRYILVIAGLVAVILSTPSRAVGECIEPTVTLARIQGTVWVKRAADGSFERASNCTVTLESAETNKKLEEIVTDTSGRFAFTIPRSTDVELVFRREGLAVTTAFVHVRPEMRELARLGLRVELYEGAAECGGWASIVAGY